MKSQKTDQKKIGWRKWMRIKSWSLFFEELYVGFQTIKYYQLENILYN